MIPSGVLPSILSGNVSRIRFSTMLPQKCFQRYLQRFLLVFTQERVLQGIHWNTSMQSLMNSCRISLKNCFVIWKSSRYFCKNSLMDFFYKYFQDLSGFHPVIALVFHQNKNLTHKFRTLQILPISIRKKN